MIAVEKSSPPSGPSAAAARSMPPSTLPVSSGTPIVPVSATATAAGSTPIAAAARSCIATASA